MNGGPFTGSLHKAMNGGPFTGSLHKAMNGGPFIASHWQCRRKKPKTGEPEPGHRETEDNT